jgi:hypothetical protein
VIVPYCCLGLVEVGPPCADDVMSGDATLFFGGALGSISRCVERSQQCSIMCATSGRPCQCPPRVAARPPLSTGLIMAWVPHALFRPRAYLAVLPGCHGLSVWALLPQQNLGERSVGGSGAILIMDGILCCPYRPVLA